MGGKSTQTQKTSIDPSTQAAQQGVVSSAQTLANTPYTPFSGSLDLSAPKAAAQGLLNYQAPQVGLSGYTPTTGTAATIDPTTMAQAASINRADVRNVNGGLLSGVDLSGYMNPYTQSVINAADANSFHNQAQQAQADKASAIAAGAFGGNREGVQRAVTSGLFDQNRQTTDAGLYNTGFQNAQQAAMADLDRQQQAALANQGVDLSVAGQNAGFGQQANLTNASAMNARAVQQAQLLQSQGLANMGAQNDAAQFVANANNQGVLANQSASIAGAGIQSGAAGLLGNLDQASNAFDYQKFLNQQQDPYLKQAAMQSAVAGLTPSTTTTGTAKTSPGLLDYLKAGAQAAGAAASAYAGGA